MRTFALQTARSGSKSVIDKNILRVSDKPLYLYNIEAALEAQRISGVYVSTDCEVIKNGAASVNYTIIHRPFSLCGDDASHHEVIKHGLEHIEKKEGEVDCLVVLLGNSLGASSKDLDAGIQMLEDDDGLDSVMSVSDFSMFNPFRAYHIANELLETVVPQNFIHQSLMLSNPNDKAAAGNVFFFNGSFWVCRKRAILGQDGYLPFPWLGKRIKPFCQEFEIELDASWQIPLLEKER